MEKLNTESLMALRRLVTGIIIQLSMLEGQKKAAGESIDPLVTVMTIGSAMLIANYIYQESGNDADREVVERLEAEGEKGKEELQRHSFYGFDKFLRKEVNELVDKSVQMDDPIGSVIGLLETFGTARALAAMTSSPSDKALLEKVRALCDLGLIALSGGPPPGDGKTTLH